MKEKSQAKNKPKGPPRHRSPNYPVLSLGKAVERATDLYEAYKQMQIPITAIHTKWECNPMSGLVLQGIAALKAYGFIEVSGSKEKRMIRLTDTAVKIIREHPERQQLLQEAALKPTIYAELWDRYKADGIPPDDILGNYLEWERKFNPNAIPGFITDFRATIAFANLSATSIIGKGGNGDTLGKGAGELPVDEKPKFPPPKGLALPKKEPGMLTDTLTLEEGTVAFQYPCEFSSAGYKDLEDWMKIQLRKIKRRSGLDSEFSNEQGKKENEENNKA